MKKNETKPIKYEEKLRADIRHWTQKVSDLERWLDGHELNHPDWKTNWSDLNHAKTKLLQLRDHQHRQVVHIAPTYSLPFN